MTKPRIAVCFFGITRSLTYTFSSIQRNVFRPAMEKGTCSIFCHFFDEKEIKNARSNEFGILRRDEHRILQPDWLEIEEPDLCLESRGFKEFKRYGDVWEDGFRSLRNLIHQLHSLDRVTTAALQWDPDIVVFVRPDLTYHQSLAPVLKAAHAVQEATAFLPRWQHWEGGVNDRFAVCTPTAAVVYGSRISGALAHCAQTHSPLHAERLLKRSLEQAGVKIRLIPQRASRTRFDGTLQYEDFSPPGVGYFRQRVSHYHGKILRAMPR